jgi:hypothetical protein
VKWIGGNKELADMEPAIASTTFPAQMPDDGPEHVIRIGRLACDSSACKLTLLYSWQAAGEMRSLESARAQLR